MTSDHRAAENNILELQQESKYRSTYETHLSAAVAPHYKFVHFLVGLCGVCLSLLVKPDSYLHQSPAVVWQWLLSLCSLAVSIATGVVAARGEIAAHDHRRKQMREAWIESGSIETRASQILASKQALTKPPEMYRRAFRAQCISACCGLFLLLSSQITLVAQRPTNKSQEVPTKANQDKTTVSKPSLKLPTANPPVGGTATGQNEPATMKTKEPAVQLQPQSSAVQAGEPKKSS